MTNNYADEVDTQRIALKKTFEGAADKELPLQACLFPKTLKDQFKWPHTSGTNWARFNELFVPFPQVGPPGWTRRSVNQPIANVAATLFCSPTTFS